MSPAKSASSSRRPRPALAPIFAALGDQTRLRMVSRLQTGQPHTLSSLTEGVSISRQAVAKHVRVLEKARLVRCRKSGRETIVELRPELLGEASAYLAQISDQWTSALHRLKAFVEAD